jgi:uncharacterized protein (DUF1778 family)
MAAKTERIEARLSSDERDRIRRAAACEGRSISSFVVNAAVDRADLVLATRMVTLVPGGYFDNVLAALDEPDLAPNLERAALRARQRRRIT